MPGPTKHRDEPVKLLAIADLHLGHRVNREALPTIPAHPEDWLIVAGDVGEQPAHLEMALDDPHLPLRPGDLDAGQPRSLVPPTTRPIARADRRAMRNSSPSAAASVS